MQNRIVLVHGWGSNQKRWDAVKKNLEKNGFEVLVFDMPGFGDIPAPKEIWGVKDYANFVLKKIEQKGWDEFYLLGHSFGGQIATFLSINYPQKIKKLILCAPAVIRKQSLKTKILSKITHWGKKCLEFLGLKGMIPKFQNIISKFWGRNYLQAQGIMKEIIQKVFEEDLSMFLDKINIPTLIIWGDKDKMIPVKYAKIINQKIPNSKLVIFENIGHSPHIECPEKLSKEIIKFLKDA